MNLSVDIGRLRLKNPVMTASGTFGYGEEYAEFVDPGSLGAVVAKGLSLRPMEGNPPPRTCETPCGMLNAIGFQNVGARKFIRQKLPWLRRFDTRVIANILGTTPAEYARLARLLDDAGVDAIEMNVSCPNVKKGGISFCADLRSLGRLIEKARAATKTATLIVKLSANVIDIREHARVAESAGAEALSLINTLPAMAVDLRTRRPLLGNITGGLSGPAVKPVALRAVWEVHNEVDIPVIGMGGISTARDALEFMVAGATAVAVGTASFVNPSAAGDVVSGMEAYMREQGMEDINELIGTLITE